MWKMIETQNDVAIFMKYVNSFHDARVITINYVGGTYEQKSDVILVKSLMNIIFNIKNNHSINVEMELDMLDKFSMNLNLSHSIEIFDATFQKKDDGFYWYSDKYADESTNYMFRCQTIRWREIP